MDKDRIEQPFTSDLNCEPMRKGRILMRDPKFPNACLGDIRVNFHNPLPAHVIKMLLEQIEVAVGEWQDKVIQLKL